MNKKIIAIAAMVLACGSAKQADAFMYLGVGAGSSSTSIKVDGSRDSYNSSPSYVLAAGISAPVPFVSIRGEVEYANLNSSKDSIDVETSGVGLNGYVGLPLLPIVKPYVGFGLANMSTTIKSSDFKSKTDTAVVPQYMVGLDISVPLVPVAGGIEYRFTDASYTGMNVQVQSVLLKGRFSF